MGSSLEDLRNPKTYVAVVAEIIGTLFLVFVGCGSCVALSDKPADQPTVVSIALAFGLSVATMVWAICNVSGGHINPAVTCGFLVTRRISLVKAILYICAQLVGAILGAGLLLAVTHTVKKNDLGLTKVSPALTAAQGFGVELLITFVLVFTVFAACDSKRTDLKGSAPLAIGLSVLMCHTFAIKFTGASMNTARTFGPAVVGGNYPNHWVYWAGPILGGVLAGLIYDFLFAANASVAKLKGFFSAGYECDDYEADGKKRAEKQNGSEMAAI